MAMDCDKDSRMSLGQDDGVLPGSVLQSYYHGAAMTLEMAPSPAGKLLSFLSLPPEIRNAVYEYPCIYRTKSSRMDPRRGLIFTDLSQAPITRVNKTIRRETLPLFYGNHKFVCEVPKPPKEFYGPRQNRYHLDSIWERLRDFDPPARHPIISNLRFLSQVTILLEVESRYFTRLGFTMSSKALVQNELAHEEWPMDTAVVYRDNMAHVVAAFIHAIAFSKPCRDARFFYHVHGISPSHLERAAIGLSSTIRSISRECPQLKSSVIAIIEPARAMARTMIP